MHMFVYMHVFLKVTLKIIETIDDIVRKKWNDGNISACSDRQIAFKTLRNPLTTFKVVEE